MFFFFTFLVFLVVSSIYSLLQFKSCTYHCSHDYTLSSPRQMLVLPSQSRSWGCFGFLSSSLFIDTAGYSAYLFKSFFFLSFLRTCTHQVMRIEEEKAEFSLAGGTALTTSTRTLELTLEELFWFVFIGNAVLVSGHLISLLRH